MKFRHLITDHAPALGLTPRQAVALAVVLGQDGDDAFKASRRGRGGGPDATFYNVALMVLAALAGGPQTQARGAVDSLFCTPHEGSQDDADAASIVDPGHDPAAEFHGAPLFGDMLTALLFSREEAATVARIEVRRGLPDATIYFRCGERIRFVAPHVARQTEARDAAGELAVVATLGGAVLAELARAIRE